MSASGASGQGSVAVAGNEWWKSAVCAGVDPDVWFPERGEAGTDAKMICAICPVRRDCLNDAIQNGMTEGIWGGMNPTERHEVAMGRASSEMQVLTCRNGHALTPDNVRVTVKRNGYRRRNCITCARASARKYKREHKARKAS